MESIQIILIITFIFLLIGNIPIAIIFSTVGAIGLLGEGFRGVVIIRQFYHQMDSFALMAIPFFAVAGNIMNEGGITEQLLDLSDSIVGGIKGSLGHINILGSILFAGISGAAISDAAALGSMLIPAMEKDNYPRPYASALTAASAMIGPIIPPSIPIVVYGGTMGLSIGALFAAGVIPGVILGLTQMIINYVIVSKRGYGTYDKKKAASSLNKSNDNNIKKFINYFKNFFFSLKNAILSLIMFLIIFGGILGGVFTVTEAAGVAVAYSFIVVLLILKSLKLKSIWALLLKSASMTGMIMLIMGGGAVISHYLTIERIPDTIATYMFGLTETWWVFLLIVAGFLIFIGTFMSLLPSIIILAPVLTPVAMQYGIHPYHFGLFFVFCLNTALITPPIGNVLFVVSGVGNVKFEHIVKEMLPFYISFIILIFLIIFIEPMTTFLPGLLGLM